MKDAETQILREIICAVVTELLFTKTLKEKRNTAVLVSLTEKNKLGS
jgi:hypothetical protein